MRSIASLLLALTSALALDAAAQEPPGRVGRVAHIEGSVAVFQDPDLGWEKAYVNSPITSENSVWTDPGARAELRVAGIAIRLDESTQLDIARLDDNQLAGFVAAGSVGIRVRHFENDDLLDLSTPQAAFRLHGTGRYRIDSDPDRDETLLTVFEGSASMRSARGDIKVDAGRAVRVYGGSSPSYTFERAATSALDRWSQARDDRWVEATSTRYVSSAMTGYEDLDQYGTWSNEPDFGAIWYPTRVAADWAPYRQGHWGWVRPWGWTWIDDAPWGYAPFHYGRWVQVRNRWAWYPGRRDDRPAWSPALVAWVGGTNFSVRIGSGSAPAIGWYPLAPWDRYEPWYRTNQSYINRVNVGVRERPPRQWESQGRGDYRTWNRDQGSTVVRRDQFVDRRPVAPARINVAADVIRQAPAATGTTLLPTRAEFQRSRTQNRGNVAPAPGAAAQQPAQGTTAQQPAPYAWRGQGARGNERGDRNNPVARPQFARPQAAPAPAPAPNNQPPARAQQPQAQPVAPAQQANPIQRTGPGMPQPAPAQAQPQQPDAQRARDAQRQQQEAQQRQQQDAKQREQQDAKQREQQDAKQREQQDAKQREQQDAQKREANRQQQLQQLQQSREERERAAREAQQKQQQQQQLQQQQQAQERAAREAQQKQQQQQQQLQQQQLQQQQAQERTAREAQERAAREAQQQAQRAQQLLLQQQQRAQQQQQQAQERAAREAQQQQQRAQPAPPAQPAPQPQPQPPQAAPQPPPQKKPPPPDDKDKDKDKDKDDSDKGGRGRQR